MARPICSVIISSRNDAGRIQACLDSLSRQETRIPFETILVDSGSSDGSYRIAARLARTRRNLAVFKERRPGRAAGGNLGARRAHGRLLLFTDASCVPSASWVEEMASPLLAPSDYPLAAVGGRSFHEQGPAARPGRLERLALRLSERREREGGRFASFPTFLPWAPARNLAVRRDVFLGLGAFDPQLGSSTYDIDFCWRLALCGFALGYAPRAELRRPRASLPAFVREAEGRAFYGQSLLSAYEGFLSQPKLKARQERLLSRGKRALKLLQGPPSLAQAPGRGLDALSLACEASGELQSFFFPVRPSPRLQATRLGQAPPALADLLPRGYAFLHEDGWAYWKNPPETGEAGELVLFRPRTWERLRLDPRAWKIWGVKAERGQSEDAAEALGQSALDAEALRDIDELTLDLRTRRLLP